MDFPSEFQRLAFKLQMALEDNPPSDVTDQVFDGFNDKSRKRLLDFLVMLLDGPYTDAQIDEVWAKTQTDIEFRRAGGTRHFLGLVRKGLEEGYRPGRK